jgi:hypothetical protein
VSTTVGERLWYLTWDDKRGPWPAVVITPGDTPLLAVEMPEGPLRVSCTNWLVEDGTADGWFEIPSDGQPPVDLFA